MPTVNLCLIKYVFFAVTVVVKNILLRGINITLAVVELIYVNVKHRERNLNRYKHSKESRNNSSLFSDILF